MVREWACDLVLPWVQERAQESALPLAQERALALAQETVWV